MYFLEAGQCIQQARPFWQRHGEQVLALALGGASAGAWLGKRQPDVLFSRGVSRYSIQTIPIYDK